MGKKNKNKQKYNQHNQKNNMVDRYIGIRKRDVYRQMKVELNEALDDYWAMNAEEHVLWTKQAYVYDKITIKAYRLLKYIRKEYGGISECIDDSKISETGDAACTFYGLTEDARTTLQEESDVLEILSRSAYRDMKGVRQMDKLDKEVWN